MLSQADFTTDPAHNSFTNRMRFILAFFSKRKKSVLPGFGLSMGFSIFYLSLIVFLPLSALVLKTFELSLDEFW